MRVLITGGSGFIGSHLCRELACRGARVQVLDLELPAEPVQSVNYCKGDARNAEEVALAIRGVNVVYHLAALVSVPDCQERTVESYTTNVLATVNVLQATLREMQNQRQKIRFVFASTSAVYGNRIGSHPIAENASAALKPCSFYGAQKLAAEQAVELYREHFAVPALVFRLFNVYGPGQNPASGYAGVISRFADSIRSGESIRIHGDGKQVRDFVSVHDVVAAFIEGARLDEKRLPELPINIGSGLATSIKELAHKVMEAADRPGTILLAPRREGDILYSCADNRRAQEIVGWRPKVSLQLGLQELLATKYSPAQALDNQ